MRSQLSCPLDRQAPGLGGNVPFGMAYPSARSGATAQWAAGSCPAARTGVRSKLGGPLYDEPASVSFSVLSRRGMGSEPEN